jgi:hypothetical protein
MILAATRKSDCGEHTTGFNDHFIDASMAILFVLCAVCLNLTSIFQHCVLKIEG